MSPLWLAGTTSRDMSEHHGRERRSDAGSETIQPINLYARYFLSIAPIDRTGFADWGVRVVCLPRLLVYTIFGGRVRGSHSKTEFPASLETLETSLPYREVHIAGLLRRAWLMFMYLTHMRTPHIARFVAGSSAR